MIPARLFALARARCLAVCRGECLPDLPAHGLAAIAAQAALSPHSAEAWAELANALALRGETAADDCAVEAWRCGHGRVRLPAAIEAVFEAPTPGERFGRAAALEPTLTAGAAVALWRRLLADSPDIEEAARVVERWRPRAQHPANVPAVLRGGIAAVAEAALAPLVSAMDRALTRLSERQPVRARRSAMEQGTLRSAWWHVEGRLAVALGSEPRLRRWLHGVEATVEEMLRDGRPGWQRRAAHAVSDLIWNWSACEPLIGPLDVAGRLALLERRIQRMRAEPMEELGVFSLLADARQSCDRGRLPLPQRDIDLIAWGYPEVESAWTPQQVAAACAEQVRTGDREAALLVAIGWLEHRAQDLAGELGGRYRRGILDLLAEIGPS